MFFFFLNNHKVVHHFNEIFLSLPLTFAHFPGRSYQPQAALASTIITSVTAAKVLHLFLDARFKMFVTCSVTPVQPVVKCNPVHGYMVYSYIPGTCFYIPCL